MVFNTQRYMNFIFKNGRVGIGNTNPSGFAVRNVYNQYGFRNQIRDAQNNALLWQTDEVNVVGQITGFRTGNALLTSREFEPETQRLTNVYTGKTGQNPVQDLEYLWNEIGNLKERKNNIYSLVEFFTYDGLNRLETIQLNGAILGDHHYDPYGLGNLIYKKADGQILFSNADYGVNNAGPHALTSAETSAGIFPPEQQVIGYNSYDKAFSISEGNKQLQITYGHHRQRIIQQYTQGSTTTAKLWAGACEYITENGQQKILTYLSGPEGVFALHVKNPNGTENIRYIHKDHLGSWHTITAENGNLLQELSFDPWGTRRNPATWRAFTGTPPAPLFDRGFTGHEHLYGFQLINMNGRMYDPLVSRMLSPDNFIQAPDFSQSFNRYSYVWNNPLVYMDPDGEWVHLVVGAVIGGTMNWMMNGGEFTWEGLKYFGVGALAGALSAGVGSGVNAALARESFGAGFLGNANFVATGFASGFVTGATSGFTGGYMLGFGNTMIETKSNFKDMLKQGFENGLKGAVFGGIIGGGIGAADALMHERHWLTGANRQDVVLGINDKGNVVLRSGSDYDRSPDSQVRKNSLKTKIDNNPYVTQESNNQFKIKIPREVNRITGLEVKPHVALEVDLGRSFITITVIDPIEIPASFVLHGWRYHSNPIKKLSDLFHNRKTF